MQLHHEAEEHEGLLTSRHRPYRTRINANLYNALNGAPVIQENSNYAVWRTPLVVQQARVAKLSVQLDF